MDFRAATPLIRHATIIIPTGTIGTRISTTIHMPGIHMHIIPLPQAMGTLGTGPTIATIITTAIELKSVSELWN